MKKKGEEMPQEATIKKSYYYNIFSDMNDFPDAWCYMAVGGRNTGKTYSGLRGCYEKKIPFIFVKRTNDDIDLMCSGSGSLKKSKSDSKTLIEDMDVDFSPFKSINRDLGVNVEAFKIQKGIGGFWDTEEDPESGKSIPKGKPIGYIVSLHRVADVKGFDLSDADFLIFDEFIPQPWQRVDRKEGEALMELYKTVSRDREHRGRAPLKLLLFANAVSVANPTSNILEVTDIVAEMDMMNIEYNFMADRGILIHKLEASEEFMEVERRSWLYKAMGQTAWGQMAFENSFAFDDFSTVGKEQMKGYKPVCSYIYKRKAVYIYQRDGKYFVTSAKFTANKPQYNLDIINEQKRFYYDFQIDFRNECINGNMVFEKYTMYQLIIDYHKIFQIR